MFSYDLYDDVSSEERKEVVALESAEIALDRAILAYDVIMESRELQLREAELKCFEESGDVNVLMDYYEAADEQTEEKKKGIISTIWDKIVTFINKILGRDVKKNDEEEYAVSSNLKKAFEAFKNAANAVLEFLTNPIKAIFTKGADLWKKLVGIVEAITIGAVVFVGGKAVIKGIQNKNGGNHNSGESVEKVKGAELNKISSSVHSIINKIKNGIGRNKDNINKNVGDENEGIVGKIVSSITKAGNNITNAIKNAASTATDKVKSVASKVKKGAQDVEDAANQVNNAVNGEGDEAKTESADDFVMTKDFADILASEPYEEAADTSDLEDVLSGLI